MKILPYLTVSPVVLVAGVLSQDPLLRYLLIPPLAVIAFLASRYPFGPQAQWWQISLLPGLAGLLGVMTARLLGSTPWSEALLALLLVALLGLTGFAQPPILAVGELALLLHLKSLTYPLDVFLATAALAGLFACLRFWLRRSPRY